MDKSDKFPYVIGAVVLTLITGIIAYVWMQANDVSFPWWQFLIRFSLILASFAAGGWILYWFLNRSTDDDRSLESPKDRVGTKRAMKIWEDEFLDWNEIPYLIRTWQDDSKQPIMDRAVDFRNIIAHYDPSRQTSDKFVTFEVVVRDGKRRGILVASVALDYGEDYIRENWNEHFEVGRLIDTSRVDSKKFPLTSSKSSLERLQMKRIELQEEGYSSEEVRQMIDPFERIQAEAPVPVVRMDQKSGKSDSIKSSNVSDAFPQYVEDDEEAESGDVQSDIEEFRRRNK